MKDGATCKNMKRLTFKVYFLFILFSCFFLDFLTMLRNRSIFCIFKRFSARERKPPALEVEATAPPPWSSTVVEADKNTVDWQKHGTGSAPHMLFAVTRLKRTFGRPWWEKKIIKQLGLENGQEFVVVKNTPSMCEKLSVVQHLVKIVPVTFPNGLPTKDEDFKYCQLKHNGEFSVRHQLPVADSQLQPFSDAQLNKQFDRKYLKDYHKKRYLNHQYLEEHHDAEYVYRRNQDGQEYRYKDLHNEWKARNNVKDETKSSLEPKAGTKGQVRQIENWFPSRNDDPVFQKVVAEVENALPKPRF